MDEPIIIAREGTPENAENTINLTAVPFLGRLLRSPVFIKSLQFLSVSMLALAIFLGLFTENSKTGLTVLLFWGIFWPLLTCLVTPSLGPVYCAVCPHGVIGKWLQRIGLNRRFPRKLRVAWISLALMILGYWLLAFSMPGIISSSTVSTAWYFFAFTLLAVVVFYIFADMAYCKYVCPLGRVLTTHGKAGGLVIRTEQSACDSCTHFSCAKSCPHHLSPFNFEKNNNSESCSLCLDCVHACPSTELHWQRLGKALTRPIKRSDPHDYWVLVIMFAVAAIGIQFLHGLQHTGLRDYLPWNAVGTWLNQTIMINAKVFKFSGLLALITALASTIGLALMAAKATAHITKTKVKTIRLDLAYALAPVAILGLIPHSVARFTTHYASLLVNEVGLLLGYSWHMEPLAQRGDIWLKWMNILPWLGFLWALSISWKRIAPWCNSRSQQWKAWALGALPIWFYGLIMLTKLAAIIWLPLQHQH